MLAEVLKRLLNGEMDIPGFKRECEKLKWKNVIWDRIGKHCKLKCPRKCRTALDGAGLSRTAAMPWSLVVQTWPRIDEAFVKTWVDWCQNRTKVKDGKKGERLDLPARMFDSLEKILFPPVVGVEKFLQPVLSPVLF